MSMIVLLVKMQGMEIISNSLKRSDHEVKNLSIYKALKSLEHFMCIFIRVYSGWVY